MADRSSHRLPDFKWSDQKPLIEVDGLEKEFKTLAGPTRVLKNIHIEIASGEFVSIIGRSGSGKSTLINMLTGIDHPTSGKVRIGDTILEVMPEGKMAEWRGKTLGIVFQFFQLLPTLTLLENVLLPMDFCRMYPPAERVARAEYLLSLVGLQNMAESLPGAFSGGQQQCAAVARALANDPPILVADEPTGNLDSASAESVLSLFEALVQQGKTILMVTHDRNLAKRANRSILISDGEIVDDLIARTFPTLPDEKLLQLTLKSVISVYPGRSAIPTRGNDGRPDILIIKNGFLRLKHCSRMTEVYDDSVKVVPGQWLDMRWLSDRCPEAVLNTEEYDQLEVLRIPGEEFQTITGGLVHFNPPGGLE